jgi:hypothetical protein
MNQRALVASALGSLVLALAGTLILRFEHQSQAPMAIAARTARSSARVRQLLGEPIRVSRIAKGRILAHRGDGNADLTIQIRGPLGRGKLDEWAQEENGTWQICGLQFESSDGTTSFTLVDESLTHCDRE